MSSTLFYIIFRYLCRITFKIGDVFVARIRACVARPGLQKCGGAKYRRGRSPNGVLRNPKMPNRHFCANRVLCEVVSGLHNHESKYFIKSCSLFEISRLNNSFGLYLISSKESSYNCANRIKASLSFL